MKRGFLIGFVAVFALLIMLVIQCGGWFSKGETTGKEVGDTSVYVDTDSTDVMDDDDTDGNNDTDREEEARLDTFENLDYDSIKAYAIANWPELAWKRYESDEKPMRIDFEAWVEMVQAMDKKWEKVNDNLAKKVGLSLLEYFRKVDEDSIVDFSIAYGRDLREVEVDSITYYQHTSPHAVMFRMGAYTSSYGEILFHSMTDFKDFMEQAEQRGLILHPSGTLEICKEKLPPGIHLVKKTDREKGQYHELYRLAVDYDSTMMWQKCTVITDWYYTTIDIIQ